MKIIPPALSAHLLEDATTTCHAWRVTRRDGVIIGFTEHDANLAFAGTVFLAASGFSASDMEAGIGLSVDSSDVAGAFSNEAITSEDVITGRYDSARVEIFLVNWRTPEQYLKTGEMEIGEVTRTNQHFQAELRGLAHRLDQPQGRIYSHRCDARLGDGRCGVNTDKQAFSGIGAVVAVDSLSRIGIGGMTNYRSGFFRQGLMTFLSGINEGISVDIENHSRSGDIARIVCWLPLVTPPQVGDQVRLVAGCDKSFSTCQEVFDNAASFRGFPHMPGSDFAYSYADGESEHDGKPLYP